MKTSHVMYENPLRVCFIPLKLKELYQQRGPCRYFPLVFMLPLVAFVLKILCYGWNRTYESTYIQKAEVSAHSGVSKIALHQALLSSYRNPRDYIYRKV